MKIRNQNPKGGTELQFEYLRKHVDASLLDQVQICTSVPGKVPLHATKVNILWQKNSWDQPNIIDWFKDKSNHNKYDWYVFNSNWNFEQFTKRFELPTEKCLVIKNGIENIEPVITTYKQGDPIKIIHHCTPWRGLSVLLGAMQLINNPLITLDVYSSTEVYGQSFFEQNDRHYKQLYEQAEALPNVNYIGYKSNDFIKKNMKDYRMFVYPSIWEETSCISLIESMSAGLYCITTNYGAIYETGAEFPMYVPYSTDYSSLARKFAVGIETAANMLHTEGMIQHLKLQQVYVDRFYNWNAKGNAWTRFLQGVINAKQ
jgi:glycosyltransferase involved in cell wall biosynthesis|tara:strand:+ start:578 stop:1525 length:948 start_codon:yes stop_codon:yes gene_type:complete